MEKLTTLFGIEPQEPSYNAGEFIFILSKALDCRIKDLLFLDGKSIPEKNPEVSFSIFDERPDGLPFSPGKKLKVIYNDEEYVNSFPVYVANYILWLISEQSGDEYIPADLILEEALQAEEERKFAVNKGVKNLLDEIFPRLENEEGPSE